MSYDGPFPQVVRSGGTGAATLTGVLTGNGTSAFTASSLTQFGVLVGGASNLIASTAVGDTGTILQGNTGAAPTYSTATYPSTTTINRFLYSSNNNVVDQLATASNSTIATNLTGTPAMVSLNSNGFLLIGSTGAGGPVGAALTQGSGISITNGAGSITLAVDGSTVGQTITGDSGGALSPTAGNWTLAGSGSITTSGSGSTLTTQLTGLTNHAVLVGAGTSTITKLAVGTTGTLLVGATGADPAFGTSATGDFTFTTTTAGAVRTLTVSNTNNSNSGSRALIQTTTGGASSGDPQHTFTITGVTDWTLGIDNSQSDMFALSNNDTIGPGYTMTWSTAGEVTMPLQPAFLAFRSADVTNVTGAGTVYTPIFDSEIYDQGGDYNTGTATFTAPVTGRYHFSCGLGILQLTSAMTDSTYALVTSNRTYNLMECNPFAGADAAAAFQFGGSTYADMDAADTATINITISNGAGDTADLDGGTPLRSFFGGKLTA